MRVISAMIFLLCLSATAHARQDGAMNRTRDRVQVRGVFGAAAFPDAGNHGSIGVMGDVRLVAGLRVGHEVLYLIGPGQDRDITSTLLVSYDFRRFKRVTPFVVGGVGMLRHSDGGWTSSWLTAGGGGGLKIAINRHFFVAPEVRVGWEPIGRATVSIGYRF